MIYNDPALFAGKKEPQMCTVTITGASSSVGYTTYVEIDGVTYESAATLEVPLGTEIIASGYRSYDGTRGGVFLNGSLVSDGTYTYIVQSDVSIALSIVSGPPTTRSGSVEIADKSVTLTLTGTGSTVHCYIEIEGVKYAGSGTLDVLAGTRVYCLVGPAVNGAGITLNGETVGTNLSENKYEYIYVAERDAEIYFDSSSRPTDAYIYITESPSTSPDGDATTTQDRPHAGGGEP